MATVIESLLVELGFKTDTSGAKGFQGQVDGIISSMSGLLAAVGSVATASSFVETASQFEQFETQLATIQGSSEAAKESLSWISAFAAQTPYEMQQVTDAFVKLQSYGLDARNGGLLQSIGNMASGMGKDLDQAVEAIADAVNGENERLKEFGIKASKKGELFTYTYNMDGKQFQVQAKNEAKDIQAALQGIMDARFVGGMEKMSKTWKGTLSNLSDTWQMFKLMVMQSGPFDEMKGFLNDVMIEIFKNKDRINLWAKNLGDGVQYIMQRIKAMGSVLKQWAIDLGIADHAGKILLVIVSLFALLGTISIGSAAIAFVTGLIGGFSALLSPVTLVAAGIGTLLLVLDDFMAYRRGESSVIGQLIKDYPWIVRLKDKLVAFVDTVIDRFWSLSAAAAIIFAPLLIAGAQAIAAFIVVQFQALVTFAAMSAASIASTALIIVNAYSMMVAWIASFASMAVATIAATWPLLLIIGAIALVIAAAYYLYQNWDQVWESISNVVGGTVESILMYWDNMIGSMKSAWDGAVAWVSDFFSPLFALIDQVGQKWQAFKSMFGGNSSVSFTGVPAGALAGGARAGAGGNTTINNNVTVPTAAGAATVMRAANSGAAQTTRAANAGVSQ